MTGAPAEMFASHPVAASTTADEAAAVLSEVFLPMDIAPTDGSPDVRMHLNALTLGRITFGYMHFREAVQIRTTEPVDYHLDIPVRSRMTARAAGAHRCAALHRPPGCSCPADRSISTAATGSRRSRS